MNDVFIEWETPERIYEKKDSDWFWTVGILTIAIVAVLVIFGNILFAIFILIASFALLLIAATPPPIIKVELHPEGILFGTHELPNQNIDSFWVEEENSRILIKTKKILSPLITIPIPEEIDPDRVQDYLDQYLEEEFLDESIFFKLLDRLGF